MADSPRRNTQVNRQARRQSPYARPAPPVAQSTPSRLRSLLSYVSPFRSARKGKEREPTPPPEDDESDDEAAVKNEEGDSADEAAQYALQGSVLPLGGAIGSSSGSLSTSASMPNFAARSLATPRFPGNYSRSPSFAHFADVQSARTAHRAVDSISSTATHELARFFQEKASRGDEHLTAVEQAGVLQLMQRAQDVPTAFTPNFRSTHDATPAFSPGPAALQQRITTSSALPKRRRPVYVGAGYSSRRRKTLAGLSGSQSESSLASLTAGHDAKDGKRRRTERDEEDDIPPRPALRTESRTAATPAKPSPLWQVSQTDAPTHPPPRNTATIKPSTRAADMMLDIIRQEDEARAPPAKVAIPKGAILNPYDSEDNLLSFAGPAKKSKPAPKKVASPKPQSPAPQPRQEKPKSKPVPPAISPLEQLERTMPAEYRREAVKPSKPAKVAEPPKPAPKAKEVQKKKPADVLTLSPDSEDEGEEDEDGSMGEPGDEGGEEEEDQLDEEREQEEEELSPPPFAAPKSSKAKAAAAPSSAFTFGASTSPFSFVQPAAPSAPPKPQADSTSMQPPAQPAFGFSAATPASSPFAAAPRAASSSSPLTFLPTPASSAPTAKAADFSAPPHDPQAAALALSKPELPLLEFRFDSVFPTSLSATGDEALEAVKDIVRGMTKAELPSFAF
ncbi:hypothetical protein Rt10032_c06g2968 [Rhodotorula toruloides]|uniref:Uncharacterized protein n=1 Tax=Rhodotorula toruloides TaxID=5286 RepID=A0A511KF05_RHOTO|nr:hypothetical protein Rt10032_c06g2968 [Rhodotorula toruloides]